MDSIRNINIERLNIRHINALKALHHLCLPYVSYSDASWRSFIMNDPYYTFGLLENDNPIAFLISSIIDDDSEIISIGVHPDWRGQFLASQMIQHISQITKNIYLEVASDNIAAINCYRKLGFQHIGVRKNYAIGMNGRIIDFFTMSKKVKNVSRETM